MNRKIILWASALGAIAVMFGALGAHALKESLNPESLSSFSTGVRYQAWHAICLLALGFSTIHFPFKNWVFKCWLIGIILFSFSIYLLSTSSLSGLNVSFLGPITPIGGLFLIVGWVLLFVGALKYSNSQNQDLN